VEGGAKADVIANLQNAKLNRTPMGGGAVNERVIATCLLIDVTLHCQLA
jgi:hypothetical protein